MNKNKFHKDLYWLRAEGLEVQKLTTREALLLVIVKCTNKLINQCDNT